MLVVSFHLCCSLSTQAVGGGAGFLCLGPLHSGPFKRMSLLPFRAMKCSSGLFCRPSWRGCRVSSPHTGQGGRSGVHLCAGGCRGEARAPRRGDSGPLWDLSLAVTAFPVTFVPVPFPLPQPQSECGPCSWTQCLGSHMGPRTGGRCGGEASARERQVGFSCGWTAG